MRDKGVLQSVGPALGQEQPFTEQAPLVADDGVQGVAVIVNNDQQFALSSSLPLSPVSPASCRPQSRPT